MRSFVTHSSFWGTTICRPLKKKRLAAGQDLGRILWNTTQNFADFESQHKTSEKLACVTAPYWGARRWWRRGHTIRSSGIRAP